MNDRPHALIVGLTGGVAAGKSAVTRRFEALGVHVYDADVAAREVIEPGTVGLAEVVDTFGAGALDASGRLDRPAMRRRVFSDPVSREMLEAIIHPRVRQWLHEKAQAEPAAYCLLAIPLLTENIEHYRWIDRVLLVDVPESLQITRLIARDNIDETLARRMLAQQATRTERLALADDVIDNSGDESSLDAVVANLHQQYLTLSP